GPGRARRCRRSSGTKRPRAAAARGRQGDPAEGRRLPSDADELYRLAEDAVAAFQRQRVGADQGDAALVGVAIVAEAAFPAVGGGGDGALQHLLAEIRQCLRRLGVVAQPGELGAELAGLSAIADLIAAFAGGRLPGAGGVGGQSGGNSEAEGQRGGG